MGNGSYNHHHHHNPHQHHNNLPHKNQNSTNVTNNILPILCRVSIKDTIVNHHDPRRICPKKDDPSSPKVTCIGKVKKSHHPTSTFSAAKPPTTTTAAKHSKLRQIFSCKNYLLTTTAAGAATTAAATSCRNSFSRRPVNFVSVVPVVELNLAELDPPLPVIRRAARPCGEGGAEGVSLWKRRSGGAGLRSLQIQPFQLQNNCGKSNSSRQFLSPTTV